MHCKIQLLFAGWGFIDGDTGGKDIFLHLGRFDDSLVNKIVSHGVLCVLSCHCFVRLCFLLFRIAGTPNILCQTGLLARDVRLP